MPSVTEAPEPSRPKTVAAVLSSSEGRSGIVVLFAAILGFISLQGDGFWGAISGTPIQLTVGALVFLLLVGMLLNPRACRWIELRAAFVSLPVWRGCFWVAALSQLAGGLLAIVASHKYRFAGYQQRPILVMAVTCVVVGLFIWLATRPSKPHPHTVLTVVLLAIATPIILAIFLNPATPQRSDMLPLIRAADLSAVHGQNPYHFYGLSSGTVFLTYLPATWIAFMPASLAHIDLRWITLLCNACLATLLWGAARKEARTEVLAVAAIFFCSPYLQYRHEIYTAPDWLVTVACLLMALRGRAVTSAVLMGIAIAMSQFSWVIFPFYVLTYLQSRGWKAAAKISVVTLLSALVLIAPFIFLSPQSFNYGVLGHWQGAPVAARTVNFSLLVVHGGSSKILPRVQALVLVGLFLWCLFRGSCQTFVDCIRWMALATLCFILLNLLVWGYFFLFLAVLLLTYVLAANDWLQTQNPPKLASS